jgi:hypothetical protein
MKALIFERIQLLEAPQGQYFYVNLGSLLESEVLALIFEFNSILKNYEFDSVLVLADTTAMVLSLSSLSSLKGVSKETQLYIRKLAVLGGSRFAKSLLPVYRKITKSKAVFFDTKEQALEYLFSD